MKLAPYTTRGGLSKAVGKLCWGGIAANLRPDLYVGLRRCLKVGGGWVVWSVARREVDLIFPARCWFNTVAR
jgi:hypothetical protein